ncbi:phosphomannomutase [Caldisphaera lagunensis DSM 15908]|uniref:Phosphomannomutase n=1 Tax=Caldisphaera lagunensis (strain DSM 15908 / JCM 11604 / ANMR 0165 / IC-154) TaxID=1056495 RepID=L0A8M5_CALLD|nr:phosphomannomutase [Caldisphaera lagunensis]AFZ70186.1 phosphomannomutase [Caldisphaera lagunensis DSM 15908]
MKLFGTAGIRGLYPVKINPILSYKTGLSLANYYGGKGEAIVGKDVRNTSDVLSFSLSSGLMAGGMNVTYIGISPTPLVAYSTDRLNAKVGVSVTASHNPPEDNGIKIFGQNGIEINELDENKIEEIILNGKEGDLQKSWEEVGSLSFNNYIEKKYEEDIVNHINFISNQRKLKILIDCANGSASNITPTILTKLKVGQIIGINCNYDSKFQARLPEPRPDVLQQSISVMNQLGADLLIAHDGDADRMAIAVPGLGFVKQDIVIALFAKYFLSNKKGDIVVSLDVGNEVEELVENYGGKIIRAKLGKIHEKAIESKNVLMAAEPWKLIDPSFGLWVDGIYEAALISKIFAEEKRKPIEIIKDIKIYPSARISLNLSIPEDFNLNKESIVKQILDNFASELDKDSYNIIDIDGYRINFKDKSWILFRASGTENKIRFYIQSYEKNKLKELIEKAKEIGIQVLNKYSIKIKGIEEYVEMGNENK